MSWTRASVKRVLAVPLPVLVLPPLLTPGGKLTFYEALVEAATKPQEATQ